MQHKKVKDLMLQDENCSSDYANMRPLNPAEVENLMAQIDGWEAVAVDGIQRLRKEFRFKNFRESLNFTNQVGRIAEEQDHHPAILTEWGKVVVTWWTHKVGGLHRNDFIMAAKTDALSRS
jgi:4a-hydroxytetrahydrobiopterin dehydratase